MRFTVSTPELLGKTKDFEMSTPETETLEARKVRELAELQDIGIVKRELPVIARSTFEALPLQAQADFMRAGGRFENDPKPEPKPLPPGAIRRSTFDALTPAQQSDYIRGGGKLVDDEDVAGSPKITGKVITRSEFRELLIREQVAFIDGGGMVTD